MTNRCSYRLAGGLMGRPIGRLAAALFLAFALQQAPVAQAETFSAFVKSLKKDAKKRGISEKTFASATRGLKLDPSIDRLTRKQPELVKPIGGYIESRVNGALYKRGVGKVRGIKSTIGKIDKLFGVDPYVVAAIWGMESGYGAGIGKSDVFRSLATLGWKRYRGDFFRNEFLDALVILQQDKVNRNRMVGSWAGAMGQTQFIPSSFLKFAIDFDDDGKRDLWRSSADALGSTANYLARKGWQPGAPWGMPVRLPKRLARTALTKSWSDWAKLGVKPADGSRFPKRGQATLFFPAGEEGPAFLITPNYEVIRDYNSSDAYSLSVGMLANRFRGRKPAKLKWPSGKTLNKAERMEVQKRLADKGYDVPNRTGRILKGVRTAIRDFQLSIGVTADGYPDQQLLAQLRR
ncbi:MAG: lytic murein transglycosylase [Pseudomonadota bacterium]